MDGRLLALGAAQIRFVVPDWKLTAVNARVCCFRGRFAGSRDPNCRRPRYDGQAGKQSPESQVRFTGVRTSLREIGFAETDLFHPATEFAAIGSHHAESRWRLLGVSLWHCLADRHCRIEG